jgi:hypothetical protein
LTEKAAEGKGDGPSEKMVPEPAGIPEIGTPRAVATGDGKLEAVGSNAAALRKAATWSGTACFSGGSGLSDR